MSRVPDARRDEIIAAARLLFARDGMERISITDVAREVGITRGLIYYYFADKPAIVEAVLAAYIDDFVGSLRLWDANRQPGNIDDALITCVRLLRHHLDSKDSFREGLTHAENAALYSVFVDRAVAAIVTCLTETTVRAYAQAHTIVIEHIDEAFYSLVYGLIGLVKHSPSVTDVVLASIIRQSLGLQPGAAGHPDAGESGPEE